MTLIGRRWKCSNACSWPILISRGLDLQFGWWRNTQAACEQEIAVSLFGFQGVGECASTFSLEEKDVKFSLHTFFFKRKYAPLAQLVEQLTLNQWVPGSNPWRRTIWPVGQAVKTAASHAANMGSIPVRVTILFLERKSRQKELCIRSAKTWKKAFFSYFLSRKKVSQCLLGRGSTRSHSEHGS